MMIIWRCLMSIDLVNDLWNELKEYIQYSEREDAAKAMVDILFDYDHSADEIVAAFKSDAEVKEILQKSNPDMDISDDEFENEDDYYYDDEDE